MLTGGGGGKIAARASLFSPPLAGELEGPAPAEAVERLGGGASASCCEAETAGRLPEPGRLGGAWPVLLGAGCGVPSIERLGSGWMGLLGVAPDELDAGVGSLGVAELLLEEAVMGRLGTGWMGLLGAAPEGLGTGWTGLLGEGLLEAATEAGGADAERSNGALGGDGGRLARPASAPGGVASDKSEAGVPAAGVALDTTAGALGAGRVGLAPGGYAAAGGAEEMSASQASSTESGGASSALSGGSDAGRPRGGAEAVVVPAGVAPPAEGAGRVSAAGSAPAAAGALASSIGASSAATPISVEPGEASMVAAFALALGATSVEKPDAPATSAREAERGSIARIGAGLAEIELAGAEPAAPMSFGAGSLDAAEPLDAAPNPMTVEPGAARSASPAIVTPLADLSLARASGRAPGAGDALAGAGGGREARSSEREGSTRRGALGPAAATYA